MPVGIDEAGRGPVIGPMVVAAYHHTDQDRLLRMGVKDSKLLERGRREQLSVELARAGPFSMMVIPAEAIDEARELMTLNDMEVLAFSSVLASLFSGREVRHSRLPEGVEVSVTGSAREMKVFADAADVDEERFGSSIAREFYALAPGKRIEMVSRHKADRDFPVVGAASILAKVRRDAIVRDIEEEIGRTIGSGYPSDPATVSFLTEWVREKGDLPPFCRRSWDTAQRILGRGSQRTLDLYGH